MDLVLLTPQSLATEPDHVAKCVVGLPGLHLTHVLVEEAEKRERRDATIGAIASALVPTVACPLVNLYEGKRNVGYMSVAKPAAVVSDDMDMVDITLAAKVADAVGPFVELCRATKAEIAYMREDRPKPGEFVIVGSKRGLPPPVQINWYGPAVLKQVPGLRAQGLWTRDEPFEEGLLAILEDTAEAALVRRGKVMEQVGRDKFYPKGHLRFA